MQLLLLAKQKGNWKKKKSINEIKTTEVADIMPHKADVSFKILKNGKNVQNFMFSKISSFIYSKANHVNTVKLLKGL